MGVPLKRVEALRQLIKTASAKTKRALARPKGSSMALRGSRGANFAEDKRSILLNISLNRKSPNFEVANRIVFVLDKAREGKIEPPTGSPSSDHQILTNIANAVLLANRNKKAVKLNPTQQRVLDSYFELASRT